MHLLKKLGFTSADFPGVSPRTRFGSFIDRPGYVFPQPEFVPGQNYFRPLDAGLLRLPRLKVSLPQLSPTTQANQATPTIRRQRTGATIYYG